MKTKWWRRRGRSTGRRADQEAATRTPWQGVSEDERAELAALWEQDLDRGWVPRAVDVEEAVARLRRRESGGA